MSSATTARPIAAACDGARKGTGHGGWGVAVRLSNGRLLERSGAEADTTNNRQELRAAIEALQLLATLPQAPRLQLATDSRYVCDGLSRWLAGWKRNGWRTGTGEPVKNQDLWQQLEQAAAAVPGVRLEWVKGHNGHALNESADRLASDAAEALQRQQAAQPAPATAGPEPTTPPPPGLLPRHWAELERSAIAADVAAANVASFGPGTPRHWESERAELIRHARHRIATESTTGRGHPQGQAGHLSAALQRLDQRYRHLAAGGWRSLSATVAGLPRFDQWKPDTPRARADKPGRSIRYEAPPACPDGGGLLLPTIPPRCWRLICERQGLPVPDADTMAAGFWPWALATPALELLICEGWKKALAAVSAGWAAVALPGVQMGRRLLGDADRQPGRQPSRLIAELQALNHRKRYRIASDGPPRYKAGRPWLIAFDAESSPTTAGKVAAAAGALAQALRAAGGRPAVARLPLLPGSGKAGLDDLLLALGPDGLAQALADTGPLPVRPQAPAADVVAPAGQWLGAAAPIPSPAAAPLVILHAAMGCGKTQALAQALTPLAADGVPVLMPSHRQALGQAAAEQIGVPWCPAPGSDERQQGAAGCWDSWCPDSGLRISGHGWSGAAVILDEWAQACEHLLLSHGTALGDRRASVLRTAAEQLPRALQIIAADAQMPRWAVQLLEQLSGRRALVIRSDHRPMQGRALHAPARLATAGDLTAADAFRVQWMRLVNAGRPFLCWSSAQQAGMRNAPQTLAALHRQWQPGARVLVIDSTTPEAAARLAADPDGEASRWDAIYCSPSISSGISFRSWKPAAVIAYAGGRVAPEHAAQALARVRSPEVPAYLFAPDTAPGGALRVGSGATTPARLIADLRDVSDPLLGQLEAAGDAWLTAWAELGAHRNRQRHAYRASIVGLLEAEGWQLQEPGEPPCSAAAAGIAKALGELAAAALLEADAATTTAAPITVAEADELRRRRQLAPSERASLQRHRLAMRWALDPTDAPPAGLADLTLKEAAARWGLKKAAHAKAQAQALGVELGRDEGGRPVWPAAAVPLGDRLALLPVDRDGWLERLQLGWLLTTPEAVALIPSHDRQRVAALDPHGRPFGPDRLRVALGPKVAAMLSQSLRLAELLQRFAAGEVIAGNDPAVIAMHATATAGAARLAAATGCSPGAKPTGTLRALLRACGWLLKVAGRIKARGDSRDVLTYTAARMPLPAGVDAEALAAGWLEQLRRPSGAVSPPTDGTHRGEKCPSDGPPPGTAPPRAWPAPPAVPIPWAAGPPPPPPAVPIAA